MPSREQISSWLPGLSRARWSSSCDTALAMRWLPAVWLILSRKTADLKPPAVAIPSCCPGSCSIASTSLADALTTWCGVPESEFTRSATEWRAWGTVAVLLGPARLVMLVEWDARRLEVHEAGRHGGHDAQRLIGLWRQEPAEAVECLVSAICWRTVVFAKHGWATVAGT